MKSTIISYTNRKGQIVIPKEYRDALGIDDSVALLFSLMGKSVSITPVKGIITETDSENSYLNILKKTKGKWGKSLSGKGNRRRKLELKASKERRKKW